MDLVAEERITKIKLGFRNRDVVRTAMELWTSRGQRTMYEALPDKAAIRYEELTGPAGFDGIRGFWGVVEEDYMRRFGVFNSY